MLMSIGMNLIVRDDGEAFVISNWFDRAALQNKEFSNNRGWFHVIMVFVTTFLTIRAIQQVRRKARFAYQSCYKELSRTKSSEWLKSRTLHISGIPVEDRTGIGLVSYLETLLADQSIGGRVIAI